jgi:CheY-like chemotaxis protein
MKNQMRTKNILVIEDDKYLCLLLKRILSKTYNVIISEDGIDALIWLTDGNTADAIIMDLKMPSIDGLELLEYIKTIGFLKDIPVIILSGYSDSESRGKSVELGAEAYLSKPFEPQLLKEIIKNTIESKETESYG